ncbi:MAG: ROK family transcriptional regulator [Bacteroidota bacterium]
MPTGTNLKHAKAYNYRLVLETIRRFGPLSRADMARRTELTAQTISNITKQLISRGLVHEGGRRREGRGAPSMLIQLNADGAYSIGLDLDKDHLVGVLVDFVGDVRQRIYQDVDFPSPAEALDILADTAQTLMEREGLTTNDVRGVGVGVPGPLGGGEGPTETTLVSPTSYPGWHNVPVADQLSQRLGLPVFLEKNATAAAVGERWYGAGRHVDTFFYVYAGAGLGGGLIVNGHPYRGRSGNAGELGYFMLPLRPDPAATDASQPHVGMLFNLPRLLETLRRPGEPVPKAAELAAEFEAGNSVLHTWLETGARHLAPVILAIEYLLDPEAIIFGGRLPDVMIRALVEALEARMPHLRTEGKPTTPALLLATAGADAAALGVATLPMYASFAPAPRMLRKGTPA